MSLPHNMASFNPPEDGTEASQQLTPYVSAASLVDPKINIPTSLPPTAGKPKSKTKPAFVLKLWTMVNDSKNSDLIDWTEDGESFVVKNRELFVSKILPKFFKHSNFASFVRQLNMYGWHKVQDIQNGSLHNDERWQFVNTNFKKDKPDLLEKIVRNKQDTQAGGAGAGVNATGSHIGGDEFDVGLVIGELNSLKSNQLKISKELHRVHQDNEMLWQELLTSREKNKMQNDKIERILQFLASVYGTKVKALEDQIHQQIEEIHYNDMGHHHHMGNSSSGSSGNMMEHNMHYSQQQQQNRVQEFNSDEFIQPMTPKPRLMIQNRPATNSSTQSSPMEVIATTPGSYGAPTPQGGMPQQQHIMPQGVHQQLPPNMLQHNQQTPMAQFFQQSPMSQQSIPMTPQFSSNSQGFSPLPQQQMPQMQQMQQMPMQTHIPPPSQGPILNPTSQSMPNLAQPIIQQHQQTQIPAQRAYSHPQTQIPLQQQQQQQQQPQPQPMGLNINAPTDSANVGGGGEPPTKRPKLSKQPTFEDLSKTIDQQGHSLNDIISRINSNQQNQTPSQQQSLQDFLANNNFTPTNTGLGGIPSIPNLNVSGPGSSNNNIPNNNFDLEDFLNSNDGLIEDLNNINTGTGNNGGIPSGSITEDTSTVNDKDGEDLINKVGSIEEIFDELGSDKK